VLAAIITITLIGQERNRLRNEIVDLKREEFQSEVRDFMSQGNRFTKEQAETICRELAKQAVILGEDPIDCDTLLEGEYE
jgi:hypothetical protein